MKLVVSWMREFAPVPADVAPDALASRLAACGFEVAEVVAGSEPAIDFEITANRPDCLSVLGLAREAAVAFRVAFTPNPSNQSNPADLPNPSNGSNLVDVSLDAPDLCPRYAAQVARVRIAPSPAWLAERLHAAGVRPINNVVDISNYVMLERGHPMHAFDLDRLAGRRIVVRRARKGENLTTLDGVERALDPEMLVIADAERATAVAGVMGGAFSEVSSGTAVVAFESAWFEPRSVRRTSKALGLKTEASARFERGADIEAPVSAMKRAIELLQQIGAGEPVGPVIDRYPAPARRRRVGLRASRIATLLGADVPAADVSRILTGLGFSLNGEQSTQSTQSNLSWSVTVPSWRVDVQREADLIEEVGRHYGYDRLPTTFPALREVAPAPDVRIARDHLARRVLLAAGFDEAVTFTFIERRAAEPFAPGDRLVPITNPLSEKFAVLRPSLIPGLLDALAHNRRHGQSDVRLFETGACFTTDGGERRRVGFAWSGRASEEHWSQEARGVDFFDARGVVEQLCSAFAVTPVLTEGTDAYLVRGRAGQIRTEPNEAAVGIVGQLLPSVIEARDVPRADDVYVGELDLDALGVAMRTDVRVTELPRFPSVARDLSILVSDRLPAADVRGTIRSAAPPTLVVLREFDRYQGRGIPEGRVSLSFHLTFRAPDRTLTDSEVDRMMDEIVRALEQTHGATRR